MKIPQTLPASALILSARHARSFRFFTAGLLAAALAIPLALAAPAAPAAPKAEETKPAGTDAKKADAAPAAPAGKFYREGLQGVDFTGLDEATKERALKILNGNRCSCGCGMTVAECRVTDPTCPKSPGIAAAAMAAIKAGKTDAEVVAAMGAGGPAAPAGAPAGPVTPAPKVDINTSGAPVKGQASAPVTIVTFEDFQCPYCSRSLAAIKQILDTYPNDVKIFFKHYPLSFHQNARPSAIAAVVAQKQNKFWEMHDILFQNQGALDAASLRAYAEKVGLDMAAYDKGIADPDIAKIVDQEIQDAEKAGVRGTPTFYVNGVQSPNWNFQTMQKMIDSAKGGGDVALTAGQIQAEMMAAAKARMPAPPDPNKVYDVDVAGGPVRGPQDAPVTIVLFSDYQCPYCAAAEPLLKQLLDAYPQKARLVAKQFPLSFHQNARPASEAALFAKSKGKFWEMHDLLFQNSRALTMDNFKAFAKQLGLDEAALEASVTAQTYKTDIDKEIQDGQKVGVSGTPTLFINGKKVLKRDFDSMKQMIEDALKAKESTAAAK
ncbi:MAG TPA: thioredoxin domain-containing protein [Candidatus Polarisedimenticolia bacterium]|nr:thioredoxin domain-containing protein [Candidatus Polarisedimenticolia bacterium]